MPRYHNINGNQVQFTAEEETARDAEEQAWADAAPARALARLRTRRNRLLAETDFYALSDVTMSDDMKTYRQNLRDFPDGKDTVDKCDNATWPTKP
jgi:TPP-dependent pyruvate/acetoin dehydrogenase alpha subunit